MEIKREMAISSIEEMCDLMCGDPEAEESDTTIRIPDGATNGDVMQILFHGRISNGRTNTYYSGYPKWSIECKTEWWNSPYKGGS